MSDFSQICLVLGLAVTALSVVMAGLSSDAPSPAKCLAVGVFGLSMAGSSFIF